MEQYLRLQEDSRTTRRTVADALDVVREELGLAEIARGQIQIFPLLLPSEKSTALVDVVFSELNCRVSLPTSGRFTGLVGAGRSSQRKEFDIALLDGAEICSDGSVRLTDNTRLRAVEVVPTPLPYKPSHLEEKILRHVIDLTNSDHCYRPLLEGLPSELQERFEEHFREARAIDYSRLHGVNVPGLKVIQAYINDKDPDLRLSQQKIADALATFGVRIPRPRRRSRRSDRRSSSATI